MNQLLKASLLIAISSILFSNSALATNAWNTYHWARNTASFDLTIVNSTTSDWDTEVGLAKLDWSQSRVLTMLEEDGSTSKRVRRRCNPPGGKVRICNLAYGLNGWVGIAGIWLDTNGHITKGYTKLNDSYFSLAPYNNSELYWKQSVACQELGHNIGLDHQDVDFNNTPKQTCMDYQSPPYSSPNQHDYDQLESPEDGIYVHLDLYNSYAVADPDNGDSGGCNAPPGKGCNKQGVGGNNADIGWGMSLGRRGQTETFIRIAPDGTRQITRVIWAIGY